MWRGGCLDEMRWGMNFVNAVFIMFDALSSGVIRAIHIVP